MRRAVERLLSRLFVSDWPARAWSLVPGSADVRVVQKTLERLAPSSPSLRIAFASDLHFGPTTPRATLRRARTILADARPDVLLLGGDYVFLAATRARTDALRDWVASIPAKTKLAVLGNHDLWTDHAAIERALNDAGARVLINDAVRLPHPFEDVAIAGLDEPWTGTPNVEAAMRACGNARTKIMLVHAPEALPMIAGRGVQLMMCGHTHGGMIAFPGGKPIVVWGAIGRKFPHGFHRCGETEMFVSRGVGGVEIPVRAWAPPDVALLTLTPRGER